MTRTPVLVSCPRGEMTRTLVLVACAPGQIASTAVYAPSALVPVTRPLVPAIGPRVSVRCPRGQIASTAVSVRCPRAQVGSTSVHARCPRGQIAATPVSAAEPRGQFVPMFVSAKCPRGEATAMPVPAGCTPGATTCPRWTAVILGIENGASRISGRRRRGRGGMGARRAETSDTHFPLCQGGIALARARPGLRPENSVFRFEHKDESGSRGEGNGARTLELASTDDGRRTTDDGRRTTDDGRRTTDDGPWTMDHGPRTMDHGHQPARSRRRSAGRHSVNTEPTPTLLDTVISPPMARARSRLIASPSPVPSCECVSERPT